MTKRNIKFYFHNSRFLSTRVPRMDSFQKNKSLGVMIESSVTRLSGSLIRNGGKELIGILKRYLYGVLGHHTRSSVKILCYFAFFCNRLVRQEGFKGLILTLKSCHVLTMQSIAHYKIKDSTLLKRRVRRRRSGLPFVIPVLQSRLLMKRDPSAIRLWLTLFSLYRVLTFPNTVVDLSTITKPGPEFFLDPYVEFVPIFYRTLYRVFGVKLSRIKEILLKSLRMFPILSADPLVGPFRRKIGGPSKAVSSHWIMVLQAAKSVLYHPIWPHFEAYCLKPRGPYFQFKNRILMALEYLQEFVDPKFWGAATIGKLSLKFEPAGKIRVFAIVDCWTQWLLYPLHKAIQYILRLIPQDGTFDQEGAVIRLSLSLESLKRYIIVSSLDLSAATDRLPVILQTALLVPILGLQMADCWAKILVGRKYWLTVSDDLTIKDSDSKQAYLSYTVGQPMGALSSWVMLALTHHFIVQLAHYNVCKRKKVEYDWFVKYAVLGDDIVIADSHVSREYRRLMEELGVEIGLAKSIISRVNPPIMEFAKKYVLSGEDLSGISFRDFITCSLSTSSASSFLNHTNYSVLSYLTLRGLGFRSKSRYASDLWVCSSRLRTYLVFLRAPGQAFAFDLLPWLAMRTYFKSYNLFSVDWKLVFKVLWSYHLDQIKSYRRLIRLMLTPYTINGDWAKMPDLFKPLNPTDIRTPQDLRYEITMCSLLPEEERFAINWFGIRFYWRVDRNAPSFNDAFNSAVGWTYHNSILSFDSTVERIDPGFLSGPGPFDLSSFTLTQGHVDYFLKNRHNPWWWMQMVTGLWDRIILISDKVKFSVDNPLEAERLEDPKFSSFLPIYRLWVKVNSAVRKSHLLRRASYRDNAGLELIPLVKYDSFKTTGPRLKNFFIAGNPLPILRYDIGWILEWPIIGFFSACLIELFHDFVVVEPSSSEGFVIPYSWIWSITLSICFMILLSLFFGSAPGLPPEDPHWIPLQLVTGVEVPDPAGFVRRTSIQSVPFSPILN